MFNRPISVKKVYEGLGILGSKIPLMLRGYFKHFMVYAGDHKTPLGILAITIHPGGSDTGRKTSKHRITTICPTCGTEVSLWTLFQHYGTKKCFTAALLRDKAAGADIVQPG